MFAMCRSHFLLEAFNGTKARGLLSESPHSPSSPAAYASNLGSSLPYDSSVYTNCRTTLGVSPFRPYRGRRAGYEVKSRAFLQVLLFVTQFIHYHQCQRLRTLVEISTSSCNQDFPSSNSKFGLWNVRSFLLFKTSSYLQGLVCLLSRKLGLEGTLMHDDSIIAALFSSLPDHQIIHLPRTAKGWRCWYNSS